MGMPMKMNFGSVTVQRYDLESTDAPRNHLFRMMKPVWLRYEPWATDDDIFQTISQKVGRFIDVAYNRDNHMCGFSIFRAFEYRSRRIMFRGNSYFTHDIRGVGAPLMRKTMQQFKPDRIITFTPQLRVYAFWRHFGEILPAEGKRVSDPEFTLVSRLAGSEHPVDRDTLVVRNLYQQLQAQEGRPVQEKAVKQLFAQLTERDALAIVVRCKQPQ